jgi:hypothetical protein
LSRFSTVLSIKDSQENNATARDKTRSTWTLLFIIGSSIREGWVFCSYLGELHDSPKDHGGQAPGGHPTGRLKEEGFLPGKEHASD